MSEGEQYITCRRCTEHIPLSGDNCPHCGKSIRKTLPVYGVIVFGLILAVGALFSLSELWFFGVIGVLLAGIGGYLIYDRHNRIQEARSTEQSGLDFLNEGN